MSVNGRLKIAVVIASNDVGGAEKRFASLVQHLQKQGVDIHLVAKKCLCDKLRENSAYEDLKATHTIGFSRSCRRLLGSSVSKYLELLLMWCQLRYICMTGGYDVFHLVAGATSFIGAIRNAKKVVSIVNSVSLERVIKSNPGYSEALRGTSVVDFLSLDLRQRVYTAGIADNGRHFVSPCSFINQNVVQLTDKKDSSVVFVGRLIALKNPLLFLRAIPKVVRQCPDAIFYLLGDGPLRGRVECELAAHDLAEKVTAGFSCAPQEVLKNAAVFVSLQDKDNYPSQSLLEAMSAKCAIVATDVGQTRMLVDDAVGRLIQPGDVEGLSNAIIELLSDPSKTKSMGKEARSRVLSNHTIEKFSDYIENLYVRAMEGGSMSKCELSYSHYRSVLDKAIAAGYEIVPFRDSHQISGSKRVIVLRHDIDALINKAIPIAEIEASMGIQSTYFIRSYADDYDLDDDQVKAVIAVLSKLNHEIGIHYETGNLMNSDADDPEKIFLDEKTRLERACGLKIISAASHSDKSCRRWTRSKQSSRQTTLLSAIKHSIPCMPKTAVRSLIMGLEVRGVRTPLYRMIKASKDDLFQVVSEDAVGIEHQSWQTRLCRGYVHAMEGRAKWKPCCPCSLIGRYDRLMITTHPEHWNR